MSDYKMISNENKIFEKYLELMAILLNDHTTQSNVIWATNDYEHLGKDFSFMDKIELNSIFFDNSENLRPRVSKNASEQRKRIKDNAEVFTPSWICNSQINIIDDEWFGFKNSFNVMDGEKWKNNKIIVFKNKNWFDYIDLERIEITCGEAPYLTSRYDVVTGKYIEPKDRIGFLDRKLIVLSQFVKDHDEWIKLSLLAYKRIYGYDFQGDNVVIARKNLLFTFIDFYKNNFKKEPSFKILKNIAEIISWNIFQMDGIKYVSPNSCMLRFSLQTSLFLGFEENINNCLGCQTGNKLSHKGHYVKIKDWRSNKIIRYVDLLNN